MSEQTIKDIKKEIFLVLHKVQEMLTLTEDGFMKNRMASLDQADALAGEIQAREDALTASLAKLASANSDARSLIAVPSHIEKIGTGIQRITDSTRGKIKEGLLFSDKALHETGKLFAKAKDVLKKAGEAAVSGNQAAMDAVLAESDAMERLANDFATAHENRLITGECSPKSSSTYLCILYAFDDIAGHLKNAVKKLAAK